jgi:hypothetical protein
VTGHTGTPAGVGGRIIAGQLTALIPAAPAPRPASPLSVPAPAAVATTASGHVTALVPTWADTNNLTVTDAGTHDVSPGDLAYGHPVAELGGSERLADVHRGIVVDVAPRHVAVLFDDVAPGVPNYQTFAPSDLRFTRRTIPLLRERHAD